MPNMDGTGPQGDGSNGRGLGPCGRGGNKRTVNEGRGVGCCRGRGQGQGMGQGRRFNPNTLKDGK